MLIKPFAYKWKEFQIRNLIVINFYHFWIEIINSLPTGKEPIIKRLSERISNGYDLQASINLNLWPWEKFPLMSRRYIVGTADREASWHSSCNHTLAHLLWNYYLPYKDFFVCYETTDFNIDFLLYYNAKIYNIPVFPLAWKKYNFGG